MTTAEPRWRRAGSPAFHVKVVVVVGALLAVPYGLAGPNFILDDWFALRNAHFDGALAASGPGIALSRPGVWLVYALEFGVIGRHPLPIYVLQSLLNISVAVVLLLLARRLCEARQALCISIAWLVLPNHGSLDAWASTMNVVVALLLLLLGCLLLADRGGLIPALAVGALFASSVLTYEATLPAALVAVVAIPFAVRRRPNPAEVLIPSLALVAAASWVVFHWNEGKAVGDWVDLSYVIPAHVGWGVAPPAIAGALTVLGLAAACVSAVRFGLPSFRGGRTTADRFVMVGIAVIVVGTVPFVRYLYEPIGAGDRVNVVSSIGAATLWTGIALMLWQHQRAVTVVLALGIGGIFVTEGAQRDLVYARAGRDVLDTLALLDVAIPEPDGPIVLGPTPLVEDNIAGLLDASNVDGALQLHRDDRTVTGYVALDTSSYQRAPSHLRFDQVAALRQGRRPPGPRVVESSKEAGTDD